MLSTSMKRFVAAERLREPIVQPTGDADRIISAVIDENLVSHGLPGLPERPQILSQDRSNHYELVHMGPVRGRWPLADIGNA